MVFFVPTVTSIVVVSILWRFLYQRDGLINSFIDQITFGAVQGADWLNNPDTALGAIIVLSIWLAGLQTIPEELYEAARMDGAGPWKQFTNVTWPGLRPTMVFVLVTITISAFALFVQIDVITQGGPINSTTTVVYHAVTKGFRQQPMGYGSAISLIFFVAVLTIALLQRWLTRDKD